MSDVITRMQQAEEVFWVNPRYEDAGLLARPQELSVDDILDAQARLDRFAPLLKILFPETAESGGIIESPLTEIETYAKETGAEGRVFLKQDSDLAVAGSVKARGGIYEVLKHTEDIALAAGLLSGTGDDYTKLLSEQARAFFAGCKMQVGSTGNLGMSIGIMSAALGYEAIVHMSADAKRWKKDLLRSKGVTVVEYEGDYSEAVKQGRALSDADPKSYFVDDENSVNLFLGYAVAAFRLKKQLEEKQITVDEDHPMIVYIPCGVGGAPGGICFGLKTVLGKNAHVFFAEPVQSPCMLLGLASGKQNGISVQDIGLSGKTQADGLAVGRPSGFVGKFIEPYLSGEFTVDDDRLVPALKILHRTEGLFIEPSSCAMLGGPALLKNTPEGRAYLEAQELLDKMKNAVHILWATGGKLVPEEIRKELLSFQTH